LGYQHQYEYVLSAKKFGVDNKLNIILFFTDSLQLCLDRAKIRHQNGLHLVLPETITEMYNNTLTLLKDNFEFIDKLSLVSTTRQNDFFTVADYDKAANQCHIRNQSPDWFKNNLKPFLERFVANP